MSLNAKKACKGFPAFVRQNHAVSKPIRNKNNSKDLLLGYAEVPCSSLVHYNAFWSKPGRMHSGVNLGGARNLNMTHVVF